VDPSLRDEIVPKNILMIGPTGCGKTEIARRLAKITDSPFVKVEATKFTEVGFHGKDVDSIIKDLVDHSMAITKGKLRAKFQPQVAELIEDKILDFICGESSNDSTREAFRRMYRAGGLDGRSVEIDLPDAPPGGKGMELGGRGRTPNCCEYTMRKPSDVDDTGPWKAAGAVARGCTCTLEQTV